MTPGRCQDRWQRCLQRCSRIRPFGRLFPVATRRSCVNRSSNLDMTRGLGTRHGRPTRKWPTRSASIKVRSIGGRRDIRDSASRSSSARSGRTLRLRESLYNRARGMSVPAVKIFQGTPEGGPVIVPYQEHLPPDVGAAKLWLSRRRPDLWREKQQIDITGSLEHRIAQMTPDERAQDALDLVARARARLAEYRQTLEHEPIPPSEDDEAEGK